MLTKLLINQEKGSFRYKLRKKRLKTFIETFDPGLSDTILDVGGTSSFWLGTGLEKNVTLFNLIKPKKKDLEMGFNAVQGNALDMHMFKNNQFDIVFSNSVIEHVGPFRKQAKFAREVKRVGKNYWVQTPNRNFPIEPHFLFPFFQFLPENLQYHIAQKWSYSHFKKYGFNNHRILAELSDIRLLTYKEFSILFDEGVICRERVMGFAKSFIACKKQHFGSKKETPASYNRKREKSAGPVINIGTYG